MRCWRGQRPWGRLDLTAQPILGATWEDLDPLEFQRARRIIEQQRGDPALLTLSDAELARALGAVEEWTGGPLITMAGLLLFGKERSLRRRLPAHEAAFQVLRGTGVEVNEFFRLPLLRLSEQLFVRFQARCREEELLVGPVRVGVPDFEPRAFREAFHNALTHRARLHAARRRPRPVARRSDRDQQPRRVRGRGTVGQPARHTAQTP